MGIITDTLTPDGRYVKDSAKVLTADKKKDSLSTYSPTPKERDAIQSVLKDFRNGWQTMHTPRVELNDMSLYQRHVVDMLAFNAYQENDGNPRMEDRLGGWKSTAMRPIQRNKAISIAAHRNARLTVPKIFAYNEQNEEQEDSAKVMSYLLDWAREQSNYQYTSLHRDILAMYSPISWGYSEYVQSFKTVKKERSGDTWVYDTILDEEESGFQHLPIPTDQVFFANFYEPNVQKQDFIILRRILSYDRAKAKYGHMKNFAHVNPGIIITMDDANSAYFKVYDPHMHKEDVEEVIRWRKLGNGSVDIDTRLIMINGVLVSEPDEPNPRIDHSYPFDAYYYLPINERCLAGKSLVFALGPESALLNAQYRMVADGSYLNLYPPTIQTGSDKVGMDAVVPGLNIAFSDKDVEIKPLRTADSGSLTTMLKVSEQVEASLNESSQDPVQQGQNPGTPSTAYEISRIEQNAATVLGFSMKFKAQHAINFGKLVLSDVLQYLTIADAESITEDDGLLYKTFFVSDVGQNSRHKIQFDGTLPDTLSDDEKMDMSFKLLEEQGGFKSNTKLWKVNPIKFRNSKYTFAIDSDVLNPRSAELERALDLETYDRAIANQVANQEDIFKDLLMSTNPKTARDPDKYVQKQQPVQQPPTPEQGNTISPQQTNGNPIPSQMGQMK